MNQILTCSLSRLSCCCLPVCLSLPPSLQLTLSLSRSIVDVSIKDRFERTSQQLKEAQLRSDLDESQVKDIERRIQQTKEIWLNKVQQMVKTIDEMSEKDN